jgi:hypothetical protein
MTTKHLASMWIAALGSVFAALAIYQHIALGTFDGVTAEETGFLAAIVYIVAVVTFASGA